MKRKPGKILFPVRSGFPPEAAADILHSFTNKNDILLDPFSESAGLAMEILQTGRRVVAIERNRVSAFFAEIFLRPASLPLP